MDNLIETGSRCAH